MLEKLQQAELDRALSQQNFAQAELEVLQTQLEPDYLLQNLLHLEQAYETNTKKADQLLDELIVYLRETLIKIRKSSEFISSTTTMGVKNEIVKP
jgi:LytS/YehU family sensor histidine kinase